MTPVDKRNRTALTILGSGTCVPSLTRSACSVLLKIKDSLILLDSGPGTMRRLLEAGTEISDISYIFSAIFIRTIPANWSLFCSPANTRKVLPVKRP